MRVKEKEIRRERERKERETRQLCEDISIVKGREDPASLDIADVSG